MTFTGDLKTIINTTFQTGKVVRRRETELKELPITTCSDQSIS